jgi:hypothetical protein
MRGFEFTVPEVDVLADFHGDPFNAKLVLYVGGNYFFAMAPLVEAFEAHHPELQGRPKGTQPRPPPRSADRGYSCNATRFETGIAIGMRSCGPIARAGVTYRYIWMNSDACFRQNS